MKVTPKSNRIFSIVISVSFSSLSFSVYVCASNYLHRATNVATRYA